MDKTNLIPQSFTLFGSDWSVKYDTDRIDDLALYGLCEFSKQLITLSNDSKLEPDVVGTTFYHELTHAILESMHEMDLTHNEKFIEVFGGLLYQFIKTAKYE
jgi:hypothetical protein